MAWGRVWHNHSQTTPPRCAPAAGHVTAGGSVCIEALTFSGGPGGWEPSYSIESVLMMVGALSDSRG